MNIIINESDSFIAYGVYAALASFPHNMVITRNLCSIFSQEYADAPVLLITELLNGGQGVESSLRMLVKLKQIHADARIVILTKITDISILGLVRTLLPGVVLVRKKESVNALRLAISHLSLTEQQHTSRNWKSIPSRSSVHITLREFGMMKFFNSGLKLAAIGERVCLSPKTVSHYRRSVYRKLKCKSEADFASKLRSLNFPEVC